MAVKLFIIALGAGMAFIVAAGLTDVCKQQGGIKSRGMSYFLCVVFVFVCAVVVSFMTGGASCDERDQIIWHTLLVTTTPALIGVRLALGPVKSNP